MANYYSYARSNYFKVKDVGKFKEFCAELPGVEVIESSAKDGRVGFLGDCECGLPSFAGDWESGEEREIDLEQEIAKHLVEGEVAIMVEAGHEKLRYVVGQAIAVNWKGEVCSVGIENIYKMAQEELGGENVTRAEY